MEFRSRPKSNYLQSAHWQELHALATHWKSDMDFFEDELRFIDVLIDKYFKALIEQENLGKIKVLAGKLRDVRSDRDVLAQRISSHMHHIEDLMVNSFAHDASSFRKEHEILEDDLAKFVKSFRQIKHEVFQLTEAIARTEKGKHLISS